MCLLAGLLATRNGELPTLNGRLLEDVLLDHEIDYWLLAAETAGLSLHPERLTGVLAAASLYGADDRAQADRVLDHLPGLSVDERTRLRTLFCDLYGGPGARLWAPLEPSALAERLVSAQLLADRHLLAGTLPFVSRNQTAHALALLFRAATRWPEVGDLVAEVLEELGERVPYEVVVGVGALESNRALFERVAHRSYPGRRDENAVVLAALDGDPDTADTLWTMYTGAFTTHARKAGPDTAAAFAAIAEAKQRLESFRGAEDALGQLRSIVGTIDQHAAGVSEWRNQVDQILRQIELTETEEDQAYVLRQIGGLVDQFTDRATADSAKIDQSIGRISAFADEDVSTLSGLLSNLAAAIRKAAGTAPGPDTTKEGS